MIRVCSFFCLLSIHLSAQVNKTDTIYKDSVPVKILYDNKIYKLNAGFATVGAGYYLSNNINYLMRGLSLNFNFHTFKEFFVQLGLSRMKYEESFNYPNKKDIVISYFNFHFSPFVAKTENAHFAFVFNPIGITYGGGYKDETSYYKGIVMNDSTSTIQNNYFGLNFYSSVQCIYKIKYDIGLGMDAYAEYNGNNWMIVGLKLNVYFSAAFKGNQSKPAWYYKKNPDKN